MEELYKQRRKEAQATLDVSKWIDLKTGAMLPDSCNLSRIVTGKQDPFRLPLERVGKYIILGRSQELDDKWNSTDAQYLGKASMASDGHHVLVLPGPELMGDGRFCFNAVTFEAESETLKKLEEMRKIALDIGKKWDAPVGMFFHVWPDNSQQHLHLHVVDLSRTGPSFAFCAEHNIPLDAVVAVLMAELATINMKAVLELIWHKTGELQLMQCHSYKQYVTEIGKLQAPFAANHVYNCRVYDDQFKCHAELIRWPIADVEWRCYENGRIKTTGPKAREIMMLLGATPVLNERSD